MQLHNHEVLEYKTEVHQLDTKCNTVSKQVQSSSLRQVFDNVTRNNPCARDITFVECESAMYRARKTIQPKVPQSDIEFIDLLVSTPLGVHYKFYVTSGNQIAVVFFSDEITDLLTEATNIQFDGTFYTVPILFYQLWTIFVSVGRYTIPAAPCLLTAKSQELYKKVLDSLVAYIPEFKPVATMSDWELASRNAFKEIFPQTRLYGCLFHYTQRIWSKVQKLGLTTISKLTQKFLSSLIC